MRIPTTSAPQSNHRVQYLVDEVDRSILHLRGFRARLLNAECKMSAMPLRNSPLPTAAKSFSFEPQSVGLLVVSMMNIADRTPSSNSAVSESTNFRNRLDDAITAIEGLAEAVRSAGGPILWIVQPNVAQLLGPTHPMRILDLLRKEYGLPSHLRSREEPGSNSDYAIPTWGLSAFWNGNADAVLRNLSVRHVLVVGWTTNYGVLVNAIDATHRGYEVTLVKDACVASNDQIHDAAVNAHPHQYAVSTSDRSIRRINGDSSEFESEYDLSPSEKASCSFFTTEFEVSTDCSQLIQGSETAFIVIDMNLANTSMHSSFAQRLVSLDYDLSYFASRLEELVMPNVNRLARCVRQTGGVVIWVRPEWRRAGCGDWPIGYRFDVANMGHDLSYEGLSSFDFASVLEHEEGDVFISKFCTSAFWGSSLLAVLRQYEIRNVLVGGCVTNGGVVLNAIDGTSNGYRSTIIDDACAAITPEDHSRSLMLQSELYGVSHTSDIIAALKPQIEPN
jgi:nicotinamidase-related amidase